jgi:lipocalin
MPSDLEKPTTTSSNKANYLLLLILFIVSLPYILDRIVPYKYLEINNMGGSTSKVPALEAMKTVIPGHPKSLMGYWYVISCVPTFLEKGARNSLELYEMIDEEEQKLKVTFSYKSKQTQKEPSIFYQDGRVIAKDTGAEWKVRPRVWGMPLPVWMPFIILDVDPNSYMVVGQPDRSYLWIMFRTPNFDSSKLEELETKCVKEFGYKKEDMYRVPQEWGEDYPGKESEGKAE